KSLGPYWCSCCVSGRRTFRSTPARLAAPAQWLAPILAPLLWLDRSRATAARATDELARRPVWFGRPSAQSRVLARAVHAASADWTQSRSDAANAAYSLRAAPDRPRRRPSGSICRGARSTAQKRHSCVHLAALLVRRT